MPLLPSLSQQQETMASGLHPPPPSQHSPCWELLSQGAEARVWKVPNFLTVSSVAGPSGSSVVATAAVCKERFPKSYRHPTLDASITKARMRGEARCLVKCRRGGVPCPAVLGVERIASHLRQQPSSCLYLEFIEGITVRQYLESMVHAPEDSAGFAPERDSDDEIAASASASASSDANQPLQPALVPATKRARLSSVSAVQADASRAYAAGAKLTRVDDAAMRVAEAVGELVADMHNVNIVHGDLTTSNVMIRNPPRPPSNGDRHANAWTPILVLIDFGLAGTAGNKGVSHEEKAVDLYVLERAFEATHPGSRALVEEILRAYKGRSKTSDSVLQRLGAVRLRGRKRECFG